MRHGLKPIFFNAASRTGLSTAERPGHCVPGWFAAGTMPYTDPLMTRPARPRLQCVASMTTQRRTKSPAGGPVVKDHEAPGRANIPSLTYFRRLARASIH